LFAGCRRSPVYNVSIRLIALDIDGTLIPPGGGHIALPEAAIASAIADLNRAGVVVVLASGRMYPGTARIARHLGLMSPLICQQGASIHAPDGAITRRFAIDPDIAHELVAYACEYRWPFAWFDAVRYIASAPNHASTEYALVSGIEPEYHTAPQESDVVPTGIDVISTSEEANRIHSFLEARYGDRIHLLDFPSVTAAHSPEASKGNALAMLAADLGIPREAVLAIGDSVNDVSMLRWAGYGVTLPHCDRYARQAADEVLSGDGIEGVAPLLQSLLKN
jgi:Cof subfamily protein (haloacid dehalogenase superfamily)